MNYHDHRDARRSKARQGSDTVTPQVGEGKPQARQTFKAEEYLLMIRFSIRTHILRGEITQAETLQIDLEQLEDQIFKVFEFHFLKEKEGSE